MSKADSDNESKIKWIKNQNLYPGHKGLVGSAITRLLQKRGLIKFDFKNKAGIRFA